MAGTVGEQEAAGRPDCGVSSTSSAHREQFHFPTKIKTPGAPAFLTLSVFRIKKKKKRSKTSTPRLRKGPQLSVGRSVLRYLRAGPQWFPLAINLCLWQFICAL